MILEFTSFAVTIKFTNAFHRFLNDMIGTSIDDILDISIQVGAYQLHTELSQYVHKNIFEIINIKKFLHLVVEHNLDEKDINSFLQGDIMMKLKDGIYLETLVPQGQIAICHTTKIDGNDVKMLVVGELSKDFEYFYNTILDIRLK
jgi:heat-inducible transcriptional repressor